MVKADYIPEKGDIVWFGFSPQLGREQAGRRPALVISSSDYNRFGLAFVCPITSKFKGYPFEVPIFAGSIKGAVLADHLKNQDWRARKAKFLAKAPEQVMKSVRLVITRLLIK